MTQFDKYQTFKNFEKYSNSIHSECGDKKKVLYHYNEWSGWRFYWKAIKNMDWKSIIAHISYLR